MSDDGLVPPGPPVEPQPAAAAPASPYPPPPPPPAAATSRDKPLGWTGLGLALAFCVPLLPLAGAVVALVALVRGRFRPRWVPALSIVVGLLLTAGQVALVVVARDQAEEAGGRDDSIGADSLSVGDCFNDPVLRALEDDEQGRAMGELQRVDCTEEHDFEVFGELELKGKEFPGDKVVQKRTNRCLPLFRQYVGLPYRKSIFEMYNYFPSTDSWPEGDRTITCVLAHPALEPQTESARDSKR